MKLGFVSAILPDLSLEKVIQVAADEGYSCVELMCWPKGKATRRYAGVTHIDVANLKKADVASIKGLLDRAGVTISGLGYYPNPLTPNAQEARVYIDHIKKVINAAALLDVKVVNTFIGRDWTKSVDANWPRFLKVWKPLIKYAESRGVKIAIENCPMFFSDDEWPGGKNMGTTPAIWRRMFKDIPSKNFGLNFDPSHFIWQQMDYIKPLCEFKNRIFHVHAKDVRLDRHLLNDVGIMANPSQYHTPKIPGLGDVDWGRMLGVLGDLGYRGPVCVEVEDRAFEGSVSRRKDSLRQSARYLKQFMP